MKNVIFVLSCFLIILTSCKKNKDIAPANTITANIDGAEESFTTNAYAQLGNSIKTNSVLSIYGANGSAQGAHTMGISLNLNETVTKGTYTSGNNNTGLVSIQYSAGFISLVDPNIYSTDVSGTATTVVITSLSDSNIQGTFTGKLIYKNLTKTVTNGKFNLSFK